MENFTKELEKKFGTKYDFLQLFSAVFDRQENEVVITFLYKEEVEEISQETRDEIQQFCCDLFDVSAKVRVKFRKSYLDSDLIIKETIQNISQNFHSSCGDLKSDNIEVTKDGYDIRVIIKAEKLVRESLVKRGAEGVLANLLSKQFIARFKVDVVEDENMFIDTSILERREAQAQLVELQNAVKTKRYMVDEVFMFFGQEITPKPEYIKDVKSEKASVIFAGIISNFQKKTYVKKKEKAKGENAKQSYFYTFTLDDGSARINCTYFSSVANVAKMDKLDNGSRIIMIGDIERFNNNLTYYVRALGLCGEMHEIEQAPVIDFSTLKNDDFVRPYVEKHQANLFDKKPDYSDYITGNTFVVFDFETTGLDTNTCEIIEIGAVKIVKGEIVEVFQTLVKPSEKVSDVITKITNISNEMLFDQPSIKQVMPKFHEFCQGAILCGYNSAMFDDKILQVQSRKLDILFDNQTCDVMLVARSKMASSNYKLSTIVKNLGIVLIGAHRALNDALATAKVLLKLNEV